MASDDDAQADRNPFTQPRFLVAAAFMLGLVVMLVWLLITGGSDDPGTATDPASTTDVPTTEPSSPVSEETPTDGTPTSEASWCGLDAVELEGTLTRAPAETEWQYIGTTAVPALADHGPGEIEEDSGLRHCFAQTPTGAVLAATSFIGSSSSATAYLAVYEHQVVEGQLRDTVLDGGTDGAEATIQDGMRMTIEGFRLLSYTGSEATVDVLFSTNNSNEYVSWAVPMIWQDGDWKINWHTDDEFFSAAAELASPAGFVVWDVR